MYLYKHHNRFLITKEKVNFTKPIEPQLKEAYDIWNIKFSEECYEALKLMQCPNIDDAVMCSGTVPQRSDVLNLHAAWFKEGYITAIQDLFIHTFSAIDLLAFAGWAQKMSLTITDNGAYLLGTILVNPDEMFYEFEKAVLLATEKKVDIDETFKPSHPYKINVTKIHLYYD